jgi:DNA-binding transcriptional regulator LsrR (DeoR family)
MGANKKDQEELAKILYLQGNVTQKEIAIRLKVTEKTVSRWAVNGDWARLKRSLVIVKDEQLTKLYQMLENLTEHIGEKVVSSKDVDAISKLTASIRQLEYETSVGEIIDVAKKYVEFVRQFDLEFAQKAANYFDLMIQQRAS